MGDRLVDAALVSLLGLMCLICTVPVLVCKLVTFGRCPSEKFANAWDDVTGSATMLYCGLAHPFVSMF